MRKISLLLFFAFTFIWPVKAQYKSSWGHYVSFMAFCSKGDFFNAEKCFLPILDSTEFYSKGDLVSVYTNLGVVNTLFGKYQVSLDYFKLAESQLDDPKFSSQSLADIYINKARTYNIQKLYSNSIEFLEKAIRIYLDIRKPDERVYTCISIAYQNLGVSYNGINDYKTALVYFEKSADLKLKYNLTGLGLSYLNIANTYVLTGDNKKAEKFYKVSIKELEKGSGLYYKRIADVYFEYGNLLRNMGREQEAFDYQTKALHLSLKNFGEKHPYASLAFKYLGDHYLITSDYNSALQYYQKALISLVSDFNDPGINSNPSPDSAVLDPDLLKIFQKKSETLEQLSLQQENPAESRQTMTKSLETIELALQLITRIRNDYISEESRLYLMENEKENYLFAAHICGRMYELTSDKLYLQKMYSIARQAKSAILHNEITDNELIYSIGIPDSLIRKHTSILEEIAAYNHLIHDEVQASHPDNTKIDIWKDALFAIKREKENIEAGFNEMFPRYQDLLRKTEPISLAEIQNQLKKDETLVEYLLSNNYTNGSRKLYIFTITKNELSFLESSLDTLFSYGVETIKQSSQQITPGDDRQTGFGYYTSALFNMFEILVRPVENAFAGRKLIIIPDEEIAYLPFDAFIKQKPDPAKNDYEGLQYLVKTYSVSYGYSSSLIFPDKKKKIKWDEVYAFSPDYKDSEDKSVATYETLPGTGKEIKSIFRYFRGKEFSAEKASEETFNSEVQFPAIFHLAMHSRSDTGNSKYSCLVFNSPGDGTEDGKLYDYEISLSRIRSPMVVLSACNTGTGGLNHGEGLMNISRAFILAGASSVVKTLWDVNDDASASIISSFYYYLSKGKEKDEAIRLAKLEYLEKSLPSYKNPYYWAGYQVMGDKSAIAKNRKIILLVVLSCLIILGAGFVYFRRRRSFLAWSW